jgi:hypothetical protein
VARQVFRQEHISLFVPGTSENVRSVPTGTLLQNARTRFAHEFTSMHSTWLLLLKDEAHYAAL